jgi:hypothetical protein
MVWQTVAQQEGTNNHNTDAQHSSQQKKVKKHKKTQPQQHIGTRSVVNGLFIKTAQRRQPQNCKIMR